MAYAVYVIGSGDGDYDPRNGCPVIAVVDSRSEAVRRARAHERDSDADCGVSAVHDGFDGTRVYF